jgi:hypothetical protein
MGVTGNFEDDGMDRRHAFRIPKVWVTDSLALICVKKGAGVASSV